MYYYETVYFVAPLVFLQVRSVAGIPPMRGSTHDKPSDAGPPMSTTTRAPFLPASLSSDSHIVSPFPTIPTSQPDRPSTLGASATPQLAHHPMTPHANPSSIKIMDSTATHIPSTSLSSTHLFASTSLDQQNNHPHSFYSKDVAFAQPSASSINAAASSSFAPKIRFALIAVLAGVPALTILGFVVSFRWRRRRQARGGGIETISSDRADLVSKIKARKAGRLSTFFGVGTAVVVAEDKDGRNDNRPTYASSIHSTAGLAGVGAHRGACANSAPPMIYYVNAADIGLDGEVETKANFDNPFGTPPPVRMGFISAPSRVSPHLPHTFSPPLLNLPPRTIATHRDVHAAQSGSTGVTISHPMAISNHSSPSQHHGRFQSKGQNEHRREQVTHRLPTHVDRQPQPASSPSLPSPDMVNPIQPLSQNDRHPLPPDCLRSPVPESRMSTATSVYGGLASPSALVYKRRPPNASPAILQLSPSPRLDQTPVLPYLYSPGTRAASSKARRQTGPAGPVIVIEAASPIIDSESEYAETDLGDEAGGSSTAEGSGDTRRTGLIGSPHGFVPPSHTFSSVSSYSVSGSGLPSSSSISTIITREYSAISDVVLPSSDSDDSSVTVKATVVNSAQATIMRGRDARRGSQPSASLASWSRHPRDVDRLDRKAMRGIAF